ncbi:SigE family RNA polymerase sigma factor [Motilibacter peucedani]|uniref:SigE family RNA polymerase sigma factor n=1 Tax=Motilibacter peucedani TaxID=598650 RepID=UPI001E3FF88A|nr:SigE family RNA polymerase sigma factor [Motilibacter peucedani]
MSGDDDEAFAAFVAARGPRLLHLAYLLTRDRSLAQDLLQTSLVKTWSAWSRIDDPDAYVRRVLSTTYASWWRRRWRAEEPHDQLPERAQSDDIGQVDARDELWRALGRLPARQRAAIVLRYFEDLSEAQTADALQISVGAVKSATSRGLARLRVDPALHSTDPPAVPRS